MKRSGSLLILGLLVSWFTITLSEEPSTSTVQATTNFEDPPSTDLPTVEEARRQAQLLHTSLHATLQIVHHRYYREDEGLAIPAATLKEVFAELEEEEQIQLRWLAVEGQAMNTDHMAKTEFELDAVEALKTGRKFHEMTGNGVYRRAGAITLTNHCLKCHVPDRKSTENRTAGLVISIPVRQHSPE